MKRIEREFINNEAQRVKVELSFDKCIKNVEIKEPIKEANKKSKVAIRAAILSFAGLIILAPLLAILIINIGGFGLANSKAPNSPSEVVPSEPENSEIPSNQVPGENGGKPVYLKHPQITINGSLYRYSGSSVDRNIIGELIIELELDGTLINAYSLDDNSIAISDNDIEYYMYELVS